jgi:hypothetical protein
MGGMACKRPTPAFAYNSRRATGIGKYPTPKSAAARSCASTRSTEIAVFAYPKSKYCSSAPK